MSEISHHECRGFTLVEILLVVAAIGILAGAGYYTTSSIQESSRQTKLQADVASLNRAVQIYEANGGTIVAQASADDVLTKLKTRSDTSLQIGMTQNFVDARVTPVYQTAGEAASGQMRAVWNQATRQFEIAGTGAGGIERFDLDDTLGAANTGHEARSQTMQPTTSLTQPSWIWQYTNAVVTTGSTGSQPGTSGASAGGNPSRAQLNEPLFWPNGGKYNLTDFNKDVSILNNNNPASSYAIYYQLNGGAYQLYSEGTTVSVPPGGVLSAYALSLDIEHWLNSPIYQQTYNFFPYQLIVGLSGMPAALTYQAAGGVMLTGTISAPSATASTTDLGPVPASYQSSNYFVVYYDYGTGDPLTDSAAKAGTYASATIDLSIGQWGTDSSLVVSAVSKSLNAQYFISSTEVSGTIGITPTVLASPTFNPSSSYIDPGAQITLAAGSGYPANYQIYYTTNGADPGVGSNGLPTNSGTVQYVSAFTANFGAATSITYTARAYGPTGYAQWFTPSAPVSVTSYDYIPSGSIAGALVGNATVNGTFVGSLIYSGANSVTFNSSASIQDGNLYFPGSPTLKFNGTENTIIQGRQFTFNGTEILPNTDTSRVVYLTGPSTPNNYTITFNSGATIQGKVYLQATAPTMPKLSAPSSPGNGNSTTVNGGTVTINPTGSTGTAGVNINSGTAILQPGAYSSISNNGTIVLGTAGAATPSVYSFQSLTLNGSSSMQVVGPVIITMTGGLTVNSVMGSSAHPEYLELKMYSGDITVNGSGSLYAEVVAPSSNITLNGIFKGSIVASNLTINGSGVAFTLPPVTSGG